MNTIPDIIPIKDWHESLDEGPLFIAGPCSAENEEQMLLTAEGLKKNTNIKVFRSGIWKPRTRPGSFEGVGEEGLQWLKTVKDKTGFLTATEVAYPQHVEACLKADVDILWIGARTTANPFSVQEIAESLKGTNIPVLIKNPVNPDISLWIGAIERLYKAGIKKVAGVHRGFFPFEKTKLRNIPKWEIAIELKRRFPDLPIICDPSHISGSPDYLEEISQKALDLNMDGLMIESHYDPTIAKSDAGQQVTPYWLADIFSHLKIRNADLDRQEVNNMLGQYREQIDSIDAQILELLAQRMNVVSEIGKYKCQNNVSIFQLRRWEKVIKTRTETGVRLGLDEEHIVKLLQLVHKMSIQKQAEVMELQEDCNSKKS